MSLELTTCFRMSYLGLLTDLRKDPEEENLQENIFAHLYLRQAREIGTWWTGTMKKYWVRDLLPKEEEEDLKIRGYLNKYGLPSGFLSYTTRETQLTLKIKQSRITQIKILSADHYQIEMEFPTGKYFARAGNVWIRGEYPEENKIANWHFSSPNQEKKWQMLNGKKNGVSQMTIDRQKITENWQNGKLEGERIIVQGNAKRLEIYKNDKRIS